MSLRMAALVDDFHAKIDELCDSEVIWGRNWEEIELFDVFEPTFVAAGLQADINLGHLVFGEAVWQSMGGRRPEQDDPITALYRKYGSFFAHLIPDLFNSPTMLKPEVYSPLFLPHSEFRGKKYSHRPTFAFHDCTDLSSITRQFPANSHWNSDTELQDMASIQDKPAQEVSGPARNLALSTKLSQLHWVSSFAHWNIAEWATSSTLGPHRSAHISS
ncbi:hypothetical protein B0H11DRAFT_2217016 [Mycena galericulata]|nr:hypothetical protein B0H11DRAFT_2217016 [Mycena galericulata]